MDWKLCDRIKDLESDLILMQEVLNRLKQGEGFQLRDYENIENYIGESEFKGLVVKGLENSLKTHTQQIVDLKGQLVKELQE